MQRRNVQGYGWKPQLPDHRDFTLVDPHDPRPGATGKLAIPAKFDLCTDSVTSKFMPPVYDQGQLGSCTANAIASAYQFELRCQGEDFMPSRLWIYYQERLIEGTVDQDSGAQLRDGLQVVSTLGVPPESDWTYDPSTFANPPSNTATADATKSKALAYFSIDPNAWGMPLRACLAIARKPFVFGFSVPESFESAERASGAQPLQRLPEPGEQFVGGHATKAVGYDFTLTRFAVPAFKVKNSWSMQWCESGYFWLDYRYFRALANDVWTIRRVS